MTAPPTDDELAIGLTDLAYEIDMMAFSTQRVYATPAKTRVHDAFLESALIHARALVLFFACPKTKDDIHWSHFTETSKPDEAAIKYPDGQRERLNKHLAHLTLERVRRRARDGDEPGTGVGRDLPELTGQLLAVAKSWCAALTDPDAAAALLRDHIDPAARLTRPVNLIPGVLRTNAITMNIYDFGAWVPRKPN